MNNPVLFPTPLDSCGFYRGGEESNPLLPNRPATLFPHLLTGRDAGTTAQLTLVKAALPVIIQRQLLHRT